MPEPLGGAHNDLPAMSQALKTALLKNLKTVATLPVEERLKQRYAKFRRYGAVHEREPAAAT